MKNTAKVIWILYAMIAIYGIAVCYFLYVGPYTTYAVQKLGRNSHVRTVVSLTTTPHRIFKIRTTLDSILDQSIKPDAVYLNIPWRLQRKNQDYVIPEWLQDYPGVTIVRTQDFGPITKLLPTLTTEDNPNTVIITMDDDVWYPRHVVRDLLHYMLQNENTVATPVHISFDLDSTDQFTNIDYKFSHGSKTALVVGSGGVGYKRSMFSSDFQNIVTALPAPCVLADDLVISLYLAHQRIPINQVARASLNPWIVPFTYKQLPHRYDTAALSFDGSGFSGNPRNYCACLQQLRSTPYAYLVQSLETTSSITNNLW